MSKTTKKGFTIVELLIVIVVMGILATIVIVTYQGVQDKANTTKNQSNAKEVISKAEAYNSLETGYPLTTEVPDVFTDENADATVKLSGEVADLLESGAAPDKAGWTTPDDLRKNLYYSTCGDASDPSGVKVTYWDYAKKEATELTSGDCE